MIKNWIVIFILKWTVFIYLCDFSRRVTYHMEIEIYILSQFDFLECYDFKKENFNFHKIAIFHYISK